MSASVSVIVPTFNNQDDLSITIKSFITQKYSYKELIVIDGGSSDNTVSVIKKYIKHISYWVSEKDRGISDAFNKGIVAAKGDYIYFMGAGDYLWDSNVLTTMMNNIDPKKNMLVCGKINRISETGDQVIYQTGIKFNKYQLLYKMALPHQGLFTNKHYFKKYGNFDLGCKYAMDYESLLRSYNHFPKIVMKDIVVGAWRDGGIGKYRTLQVLDEYHKIRSKHKIAPRIILNIINIASRVRYLNRK